MKKILSILICLVLGIGSAYSAATITVKVHAENADGTLPVHGTVTLKKTKSKSGAGDEVSTDKSNNNQVSTNANGNDGILGWGAYDPEITLSCTPESGYYVYGIYLQSGDSWELQGSSIGVITSSSTTTYTYKVVFAKEMAPATITASDIPTLDIWTGTEKSGSYPYSEKRRVNLTAAFKDGAAQFDKLYIFGLTTGDADNNITTPTKNANSNAETPCFIYTKDNNDYKLETTIANVNVPSKPAEFNITASGQKIYFTGYAPYASCGSTWNENGVFCFTGNGTAINLYFDNLQIYARPKTEVGNTAATFSLSVEGLGDLGKLDEDYINANLISSSPGMTVFTRGSGSVFCFIPQNTSTAFTPTIHLRGENKLESTQGMNVHVKALSLVNSTAGQHSSPIQILLYDKSYSEKAKTTLTIDDKWQSERTNGSLHLDNAVGYRPGPSIDLGNEHTQVNIDGGQLFFSNSYNSSTEYFVSYVISHRLKTMMEGLGRIYAIGDDQPTGAVHITDGTINCRSLEQKYVDSRSDLYHNTTSMKCPKNTIVDGGTFNCDVLSCSASSSMGCSPKNTAGKRLCKYTIPITGDLKDNETAALPIGWEEVAISQGASISVGHEYGDESLTPTTADTGEKEVYIMLPSGDKICFYEVITSPWVMCFPTMTVGTASITKDLGGDQEVPYTSSLNKAAETPTIYKTSRLFYGELDQFMQKALKTYEIADVTVKIDDPTSKVVKNTSDYMVYNKIYMLKPLVANQWEMFIPPFDVANVYVVESYPEAKLVEEYGTPTENKKGEAINVITGNKIAEARTVQSHRMIDFLYQWIYSSLALEKDADLWPRTGSTPADFWKKWIEMYDADHKPVIEQLYHYTFEGRDNYPQGKTCWDANFYLYEADTKNNTWDVVDGKLDAKWKEVTTVSLPRDTKGTNIHNVIMKKGGVYALSFPSTINNYTEHDYMKTWDYWTGKYIILEGYPDPNTEIDFDQDGTMDDNGQLLNGSDASGDVLQSYSTPNSVALRGNKTFSKMGLETLSNSFVLNNYYLDTEGGSVLDPTYKHNVYVSAQGQGVELNPAQGFILANLPTRNGMRARAIDIQTGDVTYEPGDGSENTVTGTPTIAGEREMLVYTVAGGLGVVPVVPQHVSIYNAAGQLVVSQYLTDNTQFALPTGIYLVRGEKDQAKAMVK